MMTAADDEATRQDISAPDAGPANDPQVVSPDTRDIHTYIGARLRRVFDDVAKQPVPERFLQLMRDLDQK